MPNAQLKAALQALLNTYGMSNKMIAQATAGQLKEVNIAATYAAIVTEIGAPNNVNFTNAFNAAITGLGGVWNAPVWNLGALGLTTPLPVVAVEECSAITTHGPTVGFDAAKALTNILRMIKAA